MTKGQVTPTTRALICGRARWSPLPPSLGYRLRHHAFLPLLPCVKCGVMAPARPERVCPALPCRAVPVPCPVVHTRAKPGRYVVRFHRSRRWPAVPLLLLAFSGYWLAAPHWTMVASIA